MNAVLVTGAMILAGIAAYVVIVVALAKLVTWRLDRRAWDEWHATMDAWRRSQ